MSNDEYKQLHDLLTELRAIIDEHVRQENLLRPRIEEMLLIMERSRGVILFMKFLAYVGTPVGVFIVWAKDHVKL